MLFSISHNIINYCMLLDFEKIKGLFIELLDNKLHINEHGNLFSENVNPEGGSNAQSETDDQDSVSSAEDSDQPSVTSPQDSGDAPISSSEGGDAADSISSAGGADSDSYDSDRDFITCDHVTNSNAAPCNCAHPSAAKEWTISEHHNRCHVCSLPGATAVCDICICLFHPECLPHNCIYEDVYSP